MTDQAQSTAGIDFDLAPPQVLAAAPVPAAPASEGPTPPTAEEMRFGLSGLDGTSQEPVEAAHVEKPRRVVRFIDSDCERVVKLQHPVECEGLEYRAITVRRLSVRECQDYFSLPPETRPARFPCMFDERGNLLEDDILDGLEYDDMVRVSETVDHFLPASFRAEPAQ